MRPDMVVTKVEERKIRDVVSFFDTKFLFIFGFKILKVGLVDFAYAMFIHFDKSAWDVRREGYI